jgi:hypothetical protein
MRYLDVQVIRGQRVRLSVLGKERCPKSSLKTDAGVVLGKCGNNAVRILFDGRKQPITLHLSYIEMQ